MKLVKYRTLDIRMIQQQSKLSELETREILLALLVHDFLFSFLNIAKLDDQQNSGDRGLQLCDECKQLGHPDFGLYQGTHI